MDEFAKEPTRIGYLTDDPTAAYNAGLDAADSLAALRKFLAGWPTLAPDARRVARAMKDNEWAEWRRGLALERGRKFSGEAWAERYGAVLMPERMIRASMVADQFYVPWGVAWIRLRETESESRSSSKVETGVEK